MSKQAKKQQQSQKCYEQ